MEETMGTTTLPSVKERTEDFRPGEELLDDDVAAALPEDLVLHAGTDGVSAPAGSWPR